MSWLWTHAPSNSTSIRAGTERPGGGALAGGATAVAASAACAVATRVPTVPTTVRTDSTDNGTPRNRPSTSAACR